MATYYVILTNAGLAAVAVAAGGGAKVDFSRFGVGDGNGAYHEPTAAQTALVNERWRGDVNRVYADPQNANRVIVEAMIPASAGGWDIREVGVFSAGGTLLAVGKYPLTTKPAPGSGSEKDLYVRLVLAVTNGGAVTQTIDPSVVMATQEYVDTHAALTSPHSATSAATGNRLLVRDANGRAQVADPSAASDIATKRVLDQHAAVTTAHGATSAATANRLILRDATGRAQVTAPAAADDVATLATVLGKLPAAGHVLADGTVAWIRGATVARLSAGRYRVTHGLGSTAYAVTLSLDGDPGEVGWQWWGAKTANTFEVYWRTDGGTYTDKSFTFAVHA